MTRDASFACSVALALAVVLLPGPVRADVYRCERDGRVVYGDRPCNAGERQSNVAIIDDAPSAADRSITEARARRERTALASIERDRAAEERSLARESVARARLVAVEDRRRETCARLALRAKRAHEAFDEAAPHDVPRSRTQMRKADDEMALRCRPATR